MFIYDEQNNTMETDRLLLRRFKIEDAARVIIQYGFDVKKFHKINARYFTYNPASGRVMEKAGMEREGLQKKHVWKIDKFEDVFLYGIVNSNV